jgi:hypothetical protein
MAMASSWLTAAAGLTDSIPTSTIAARPAAADLNPNRLLKVFVSIFMYHFLRLVDLVG